MPKIVFVNPAKNYGSTGKIVEQIGLIAKSEGWEPYLIHSSRYDYPSQLKCIKTGSVLSEKWHALMSFLFDRHGLHSKSATRNVIKLMSDIRPDIIHLHNIHGYFINYPLLFTFLRELNIPVIWTMHDCWSFTGHCTYFDIVGCDKWRTECCQCPNLSCYPQSKLIDQSNKNFYIKRDLFNQLDNLTLVPVSEWLGELTKQSFLGRHNIHVIHNGVDTNIFRIKQNNLRHKLNLENKFIILGVSSNGFTGRKGLDDFIKLSNMLSDDYKIIMIGLTDNELNKLPKSIIGMKRTVNVEELVDFYNIADVFINPTYSDNFPTTNIEALACGTPVITYKTGGSPEAIDELTGHVVEQGDVSALAQAIINMKKSPLSQIHCRQRATKMFDKDKCFREYIMLYNNLLTK